jgi:hypothetical protein
MKGVYWKGPFRCPVGVVRIWEQVGGVWNKLIGEGKAPVPGLARVNPAKLSSEMY